MSGLQTPIGCALLTSRNTIHASGWASVAGGDPFRVSSIESLESAGPVWVLSTPEQAFLADVGANGRHLRHANFLPTPITAVAEEIAPPDANNFGQAAQRASEVLTRVVALADSLAPVSNLLLHGGLAGLTLTSALQQLAAPILRSDPMPEALLGGMQSLFKAPPPLGSPSGSDIAVRIPANRIALSEKVLGTAVPGPGWEEVPRGKYPNPLSWAVGDAKPVIAQVTVRGALPGAVVNAPLTRHLTRGAVQWMAVPEIAALSQLVDMTAERVFVANEVVPATASLKIPTPAFAPAARASISAGLLAEAYLHAACMPAIDHTGSRLAPRGTQAHSVRAAWLTSTARALMVREAMALSTQGFAVIGYGVSHVLVSIATRSLPDLRKAIGRSALLSYPAGLRLREARPVSLHQTHEMVAVTGGD